MIDWRYLLMFVTKNRQKLHCYDQIVERRRRLWSPGQMSRQMETCQQLSEWILTRCWYTSSELDYRSLMLVKLFLCHNTQQPRSQHCLSTALAQAVRFSTLIGCHLDEKSVRKFWKLNFDTKILTACSCNRQRTLYCSSHKNNSWTTKRLTCMKVGIFLGW